ncbi:uncharacterized protein TNCV_3124351 [Trichonephila clavipes]|nr:uncharacterized protein TNCV_3124351 [Trichonephila clavipes]
MSIKSPFAIQKALIGIGGEPKSVKRLRSGDLLIETTSALQTKSFLLAKSFLNSPVTVFPHKSLNSCRGVISEPDLLGTSDSEILEGFSGQGVTQVRRITIKKDSTIIPTKHLILTFTSPTLPQTIKAGYLNCKIRPYIPNPLRCFKCQRFGHSQTACRGQLTCSRCASVGHASSDCTLEQKCVNCSQPHSADSKLCPKWKIEKEIQTIKTNRNISYIEARKFITPQPSQTYAQVAKSITVNNSSQTDETITKIVCPPLKLLQPLITISKPIMSPSIPEVIKSSTSTQAELVPSTSSVTVASPSQSSPPNSVIDTTPTTSNSLSISAASSSSQSVIPPPSDSYKVPDAKKLAKARSRKRKKELLKKMKEAIVDIKMNPHRPKKPASDESTSDEEEMIVYDVEDEIESNPDYVKENAEIGSCANNPKIHSRHSLTDQGVIQVRRITIKRDSNIIPTKHIILTFNKPKLPTTVKAGYLNCKIRPYIPNPLSCFQCQRFGHSQTSCRGQLTCSRCASVGHSSTDCTLEPKCVNCTQSHSSDSKLCQKWKLEKQIQEIKTNKNLSYFEARRLIVPQLTQTYAQAARPSTVSTASQTDPNITNIICPLLQCLKPISSKNPMPSTSRSVSTFSTSSSSTQDNLLPSPSGILPTIQSESLLQIPIPTTTTTTPSPGNNLNTLVSPLETETRSRTPPAKLNSVSTENLHESVPNESNSEHSTAAEAQQIVKRKSRNRRKRSKIPKPNIEIKKGST